LNRVTRAGPEPPSNDHPQLPQPLGGQVERLIALAEEEQDAPKMALHKQFAPKKIQQRACSCDQ